MITRFVLLTVICIIGCSKPTEATAVVNHNDLDYCVVTAKYWSQDSGYYVGVEGSKTLKGGSLNISKEQWDAITVGCKVGVYNERLYKIILGK